MPRPSYDPDALIAAALAREQAGDDSCRDFGLAIARDGTWSYQGSPIRRPELVKLFASILRRGPDGSHWLVTPVEQGRIEVEDAAFTIVELRRTGPESSPLLELRTNLDAWIPLDSEHPMRLAPAGPEGWIPYVLVRDGLEARVNRSVFYELVELAEPQGSGAAFGVRSGGLFFALGEMPGEAASGDEADGRS